MRTFRFQCCLLIIIVLSGCDSGYHNDGKKVDFIIYSAANGKVVSPLDGADPETFTVISSKFFIAKDKFHVYIRSSPIKYIDANSYGLLKVPWAKDKNRIYYDFSRPVKNADVNSFTAIDGLWGKDRRDWYYQSYAMNVCDLKSFRVIYSDILHQLSSDNKCVYLDKHLLTGVDQKSLKVVGRGKNPPVFFKDKYHVYTFEFGKIITGADPGTFRDSSEKSYDKYNCYNYYGDNGCRSYKH